MRGLRGGHGYTALVAEVDVDQASGRVQPRRFTVALDCGPISNPDGLRNQTEGGILQGTSRALVEEVTWDDKQVTSKNWTTYDSLYLGFDIPIIDIILMNPRGVLATGSFRREIVGRLAGQPPPHAGAEGPPGARDEAGVEPAVTTGRVRADEAGRPPTHTGTDGHGR